IGIFRRIPGFMPQFRNLKRRQHTRHAVEIPAVWYRVQVGARHEYFRIIMAPVSPEYIAGTIGADTHADIFHPAGDFLLRLLFRPNRASTHQFPNLRRSHHTRHAVEIPAVWYRVQVGARHEYFRIIMAPVSPEYIAGTIGADTHADIFHPAGDFLLRLLFRHGV